MDYSDVPQRTQRSASTSSATASYTSAHLHHLDRSNNRMDNDQVIIQLFYSFPNLKEKNPENPCHKIITKFEETAGGLAKADTVPPGIQLFLFITVLDLNCGRPHSCRRFYFVFFSLSFDKLV